MFNKDFLFSAIKRIFAGDPIKFKFYLSILKSASNLNGNLNGSKELEHYASG